MLHAPATMAAICGVLGRRAVLVVALAGIGGCAQPRVDSAPPSAPPVASPAREDGTPETTAVPTPTTLWAVMAAELSWPIPDNPRVSRERQGFLDQPQLVAVLGERAEPALQAVVADIRTRDLPMELALVPVVESMLDPLAVSSADAAGLWQISPVAADHLGLHRSWWFDARLDRELATAAALDYLVALREQFDGDWLLALAAYNAGETRIRKLRQQQRARGMPDDFWHLNLPAETARYVPRLLALSALVRDPGRYGLAFPDTPITPALTRVATGGQIELETVARLAQMDTAALHRLNAGHRRWLTAPDAPARLWLPTAAAPSVAEALANLEDRPNVQWNTHRVEPGDSLARIARRNNLPVEVLMAVNGLDDTLIHPGDTLLLPNPGSVSGHSVATLRSGTGKPARYEVRSGDSLWSIARRFSVDVDSLVLWNRLSPGDYLQPGQRLRLVP